MHSCHGRQRFFACFEQEAFFQHGTAVSAHRGFHPQTLEREPFTGRLPARRENLPPEQTGALGQANVGALRMTRPGVGDHWVRQVFEQGCWTHRDRRVLLRVARASTMPIQTRRARGGDLRRHPRFNLDVQRQPVPRQHAARDVVQVHQRACAGRVKRAHDLPGRILPIHAEAVPSETQTQLMKRRVSIDPWRIEANSRNGLKHPTSSLPARAAAFAIAEFRFQIILPAAD